MQHTDKLMRIMLCALALFLGFLTTRTCIDLATGQGRGARHYDHVHYLGGLTESAGAAMILLDTRNGDVWIYGLTERTVLYLGKLTELGQPLTPSPNSTPAVPAFQPHPIRHASLVRPASAASAPPWDPTSRQDR